jgi:tetratricopeptide (TPR) repeat protein
MSRRRCLTFIWAETTDVSGRRNEQAPKLYLNIRALIALLAVILTVALGIGLSARSQQRRMSREALATAEKLLKAGEPDLATRHLSEHLSASPNDTAALELKSQIMAGTAQTLDQLVAASKVHDQLLTLAPEAGFSQDARRRLVELDVRFGDKLKATPLHTSDQQTNETVAQFTRYRAAEVVARELIRRGARDPGAYLLRAKALDGMAVPGDRDAQNEAVREYQNVLAMEPGNISAADRLARLYQERLNDPARAEQVLADLIKAVPNSVEARLNRHRLFVKIHKQAEAATELEEAAKLAHEGRQLVDVLVTSAEFALKRGDAEAARKHLERVPEKFRENIQVLMIRGLIDFDAEQPDEAIDAWRRGLEVASGTDAEMTWWLAYALLQMNRVADAAPLIEQYQRFASDDAPLLRFLEALYDERSGRPARAVETLESIRQRILGFEGLIWLARGRCHEALWNEPRAIESYNHALSIDPSSVIARLAIAKLKLRKQPDDAVAEIDRGLRIDPENPALLIARAGARLQQEAIKPPKRRSWENFDRAWKDASEHTPNNAALALMWCDRLGLDGRDEEGVKFLEEAAAKSPRSAAVAIALADGFLRLLKPDKALKALDRAAAPGAAGDQAGLRIVRTRALTALFRGREARAALTDRIENLPASERAQVLMVAGQLDILRGELDAARRDYERWIGLNPIDRGSRLNPIDPRPFLALLELALAQNDGPLIKRMVENLLALARDARSRPETPELAAKHDAVADLAAKHDLTYMIGRVKELLWQADNPDPKDLLETDKDRLASGEASSKRSAEEIRAQRVAEIRAGKIEEARKIIENITSDAPELPVGQMLRADVLERQGHLDEAISVYVRVWERGTQAALPRLISLLGRRRRYDAITQLREKSGPNTQVDLLSAQLFVRIGDRTQAGRIAEQLAQDLSSSGEALNWQSRMLDHIGRLEDAENALRALAERQPNVLDPWLRLIRYQVGHKRTQAAAETIVRVKATIKSVQPELLDARCARAAGDQAAASKAFAAAVAAYPGDVPVCHEAAQFHQENNEFVLAEAALREALKRDPSDRRTLCQLAVVLSARAAATKDPTLWKQGWELLGPEKLDRQTDPETRFARAVMLSEAPEGVDVPGSLPGSAALSARGQAETRLKGLIADLPVGNNTASAAREFLSDKLLKERDRSAEAARIIEPMAVMGADPTAIALYARALIQSKKIDAAEWQLDRLAALSPGDPREATLRASLIWNRSRPVDAAQALEQAFTIHEDDPGAEALGREAFRMILALGNARNPSIERLALRMAKKNAACGWMPAQLYARRGLFDEAIEQLEAAAAQSGARYEDLLETGRVAMEVAANSADSVTLHKVEGVLNTLIRSDPKADDLLILMAMLRHLQRQFGEEARLYRVALERRPENFVILNNLAWALSEGLQQYEEALPYAEQQVKILGENHAGALDTRGVILFRLGKNDPAKLAQAIEDLEKVAKLEPGPLHDLHLARAYALAGRKPAADDCLASARKGKLVPQDIDPAERDEILSLLTP